MQINIYEMCRCYCFDSYAAGCISHNADNSEEDLINQHQCFFRFRRAALSRVSRAVARSLKIKMRREERIMKEKQTLSLKQQKLQQQQQQQIQTQPKKPVYQFQPLDSTPPQQQAGGKVNLYFIFFIAMLHELPLTV